jgi:hypothetical protein
VLTAFPALVSRFDKGYRLCRSRVRLSGPEAMASYTKR